MPQYTYRPMCAIVLAPWEAEEVLDIALSGAKGTISAGHGAYAVNVMPKRGGVVLRLESPQCRVRSMIDTGELRDLLGERRMLVAFDDRLFVAEIRDIHFYKLVPTISGSMPTLEINGIHMHRVRGSDPAADTRSKVAAVRIRKGVKVLDTCMGLGYTAIGSLMRGAGRVVTVEINRNVIELARVNPWSWGLEDPRITVVHDNVVNYVRELEDESFDRVIHDPPRIMRSTGELYSLPFYRELYRVLRKRGVLFHYTGEPGRKHGANFPGRIAARLEQAGFRVLRYSRHAMGIIAVKE